MIFVTVDMVYLASLLSNQQLSLNVDGYPIIHDPRKQKYDAKIEEKLMAKREEEKEEVVLEDGDSGEDKQSEADLGDIAKAVSEGAGEGD